jgi:hypothetical protein
LEEEATHDKPVHPLAFSRHRSLTSAALIVGSFGPAAAQTTPNNKPPAAAAATSSKPETVEQRINQLKTALKIMPNQESKWNAVAQAMRENAASME